MWVHKAMSKFLRHTVLYGLANVMIFAGMFVCVVGGFLFVVAPWVTWCGLAVFIGGFFVLAHSDDYLPGEKRSRIRNGNR